MSSFEQIRTNLSTLPRTARLSIRDWRIGRSGAGYSMAALQPLIGDRYLPWSIYSVNSDPARSVELAIVDGPAETAWSRWGALPYLEPRLAERCAFVLDDIHRSGAHRIAKDWRKRLGGEFVVERQSLVEWYRRGDFWEVD